MTLIPLSTGMQVDQAPPVYGDILSLPPSCCLINKKVSPARNWADGFIQQPLRLQNYQQFFSDTGIIHQENKETGELLHPYLLKQLFSASVPLAIHAEAVNTSRQGLSYGLLQITLHNSSCSPFQAL